MKAYIVFCKDIKTQQGFVFQEGYKTIKDAQNFCSNIAGNPIKINDFTFIIGGFMYEIKEIKII